MGLNAQLTSMTASICAMLRTAIDDGQVLFKANNSRKYLFVKKIIQFLFFVVFVYFSKTCIICFKNTIFSKMFLKYFNYSKLLLF